MTSLLVGDLDLGTKGQRFVRRRHGVIVERNAAGSFGSRLRRVTHGVHRCDTVFGTNWNVEQTKYKRRHRFLTRVQKIPPVSVDAGFPPQTAKRWPGFRHKPRNQKPLRRNSPETEVR